MFLPVVLQGGRLLSGGYHQRLRGAENALASHEANTPGALDLPLAGNHYLLHWRCEMVGLRSDCGFGVGL